MIIIDRFEGEYAVLETDNGMLEAEKRLLPENSREGDVLRLENEKYVLDEAATEERRAALRARLNKLRRK